MKCEYCDSIIIAVPADGICPHCGAKLPANAPVKIPPDQEPLQPDINRCSCCKSRDITVKKRGFSWGWGLPFAIIIPVFGIFLGFIGRNTHLCRCQTCGHKWKH